MANDETAVPAHLWAYALGFEELTRAADDLRTSLQRLLDRWSVQVYQVEARAKSLRSYQAKAEKTSVGGVPKYADPANEIDDSIAARVIVFTTTSLEAACEMLRREFKIREDESKNLESGYFSHHMIIRGFCQELGVDDLAVGVPDGHRRAPLEEFFHSGRHCEVQLRTVAAHAWAEYEHDVRYKPGALGSLPQSARHLVTECFREAASARQRMDEQFSRIEALLATGAAPSGGSLDATVRILPGATTPLNLASFQSFLDTRYPDYHRSSTNTTIWFLRVLSRLKFNSVEVLQEVLDEVDPRRVAELMDYRFEPSQVRRLDDDLLSIVPDYARETGEVADGDYRKTRAEYLPYRLRRLQGKLSIYQLRGEDVPEAFAGTGLSAAGALRATVAVALSRLDPKDVLVEGLISDADDLGKSARAARWDFSGTSLWVHGNLTRDLAEDGIRELLNRLEDFDIQVLRAGDPLGA